MLVYLVLDSKHIKSKENSASNNFAQNWLIGAEPFFCTLTKVGREKSSHCKCKKVFLGIWYWQKYSRLSAKTSGLKSNLFEV